MVFSKCLTASRLGKNISILPVPLPEDTHRRFIRKWKLQVLLDQHRHHSDRTRLLRFFLQGHLNNNTNLDLDVILKVMLERLDAVNSFLLIKKGRQEQGWMACILCYFSKR